MKIPQRAVVSVAVIYLAGLGHAQILREAPVTEVIVETTPRAEISWDDRLLGTAPLNGTFLIHNAKPGEHALRVTLRDKDPFTRKVMVSAGKTITIRAELANQTGDLEVLTTPGAEILINGKPGGVADAAGRVLIPGLSVGAYKVRAGRAGFNTAEREIPLPAGMVSTVTIDLKPIAAAAEESGSGSPPNYVLHRRLIGDRTTTEIFFQAKSLRLVSIGHGSSSDIERVIQWDAGTGRVLHTVEVSARYGIRSVSPDLRWVCVRNDGDWDAAKGYWEEFTRLVEAESGRLVREWSGDGCTFTPDSQRLVIMDTKAAEAVFFDVESGKRIKSWKTTSSGSIMYSPDGRWVAIGGGEAGVSIHEAETGKQIQRLGTKAWLRYVTFSPDGRWLAAMAGTKMELWEVATGLQGRSIEGGASDASALKFNSAVFTPDSRYIISVNESALRLWEVRTGREVRQWPVEGYAGEIALSADGRWLVLTGTHLTVWRRAE